MKKIILVLISALIVLGVFAGCKGGADDSQGTSTPTPELKVTLSNGAGTNWKIAGEDNLDINVAVTNGDTATIKYAKVGEATVEGVSTVEDFNKLTTQDVTGTSFNVTENGTYTVLVDRVDSVRLETIKVTNFKARPSAPTYTKTDLIIADSGAPLMSADGSKPVFKMSWTYDYTGTGADVGSFKVVYTQIVNGEAGTQKEIVVNKNMNTVEIPVEIENAEGFALNYKVKVIAVDKTTHFESLSEEVTKEASELLTVPPLPTELKRIIPEGYDPQQESKKKWFVVDLGNSNIEFTDQNVKFLSITLPEGDYKITKISRKSATQISCEIEYTGTENIDSESKIFAGKSITARIGSAEKTSPFTQFIVSEKGVLTGFYGVLAEETVTLPKYAQDIGVSGISGKAIGFETDRATKVTKIIIPEGYTTIGRFAFLGVKKNIVLPTSIINGFHVYDDTVTLIRTPFKRDSNNSAPTLILEVPNKEVFDYVTKFKTDHKEGFTIKKTYE